ncbi:LTXXQ motif protein [Gimesia aquarii]|uniref:LTXXQ motif protein n=2 Tax=Gimesia aquarii TaxID=2527964 RepID=A0A517X0X7_9PLAN|nr:LTXXQ motif protein [Gimesia aquarii]
MLKLSKALLTMTLIFACVASVNAADKEAKKKKGKKQQTVRIQALNLPKTIELTDEQKEKIAGLKKEYTPQFVALQKKNREILTPDQRKARGKAMKQAKEEGKKGKELRSAVNSALKLSDDQSKQMKEVGAEMKKLNGEVRGKLSKILTADQLAKIKKPGKGSKKKKKKNT